MILTNSVGVIDSTYRGEIIAKFRLSSDVPGNTGEYQVGDRICQLVIIPIPQIKFEEVEELASSTRGEKGFGSSGK